VRGIARALGRAPSTISRELRRNAATRGGKLDYRASVAQWKADLLARRPNRPNWLRTSGWVTMCSSGDPVSFVVLMGRRSPGR
jgi:hypothetical protein